MRSQRLLKVHRLNPTPLQPNLQNGVIVWTRTALLLHLLWAWQFIVSVSVEVTLAMLHDPWGSSKLKTETLVLMAVNAPFCALPILEACLYANLALTSTRYLLFQLPKLAFYVTIYVLRSIWFQGWCISSIEGARQRGDVTSPDAWYVVGRVVEVLLYIPPYVLALLYGAILRRRERAARLNSSKLAPDRILVVVTPADEETRLLE